MLCSHFANEKDLKNILTEWQCAAVKVQIIYFHHDDMEGRMASSKDNVWNHYTSNKALLKLLVLVLSRP